MIQILQTVCNEHFKYNAARITNELAVGFCSNLRAFVDEHVITLSRNIRLSPKGGHLFSPNEMP